MSTLHRYIRLCATLVSFALLIGCASTAEITTETRGVVEQQWRALEATEPCCEDFGSIKYTALPASGQRFEIEPGRARVFSEGKSYFYGMDVSKFKQRTLLMVKAHPVVWRRRGLPYVFKPSVVFLDAQARETAKRINLPLCYSQGWTQAATGYFSMLAIEPDSVSKLVFFSAQSAQRSTTKFDNSATTAGAGMAMTFDVHYEYPHAPVGELEVVPLSEKMKAYLEERCPELF